MENFKLMQIQSERVDRDSTPRSKILFGGKTHIFNMIALQNLVHSDQKFYIKLSRNKTPEQHGDKRPISNQKLGTSKSTAKNYSSIFANIGPESIRSEPFQIKGAIKFTPDPPKPRMKFTSLLKYNNNEDLLHLTDNKSKTVNFDEIKNALRNELNRYSKFSSNSKSPVKITKDIKATSVKKFNLNYSKTSNNETQPRVLLKYSSNIPIHVKNRLSHTRPDRSSYRGESQKNSSINSTKRKNESSIANDAISINRETLIDSIKDHVTLLSEIPTTSAEYYSQVGVIGKGAYATVILAIHRLTGKKVAIKCIDKTYIKDQQLRIKILQEISILRRLRHSNIIRLYEVFETSKQLNLVMEYTKSGDLFQLMKKTGRMHEQKAKEIFKQLLYALAHIHSRNILHRDIKPANILIDVKGMVKLSDFGNSRVMKKGITVHEQCGTIAYMAPEIAFNQVNSLFRNILAIPATYGVQGYYYTTCSHPPCPINIKLLENMLTPLKISSHSLVKSLMMPKM